MVKRTPHNWSGDHIHIVAIYSFTILFISSQCSSFSDPYQHSLLVAPNDGEHITTANSMASQSTLSVLASSASSSSAPPLLSPPSPRLVRFQEQCALIPELSVLVAAKSPPRVMTKSLSLPVLNLQLPWKRSSVAFPKQPSNSERHQQHAQSVQSSPPVVIKVPVPM